MNHIHDAGKVFPLFCSFSMERRLNATTSKFKVYIRALLESNKPFWWSALLWPELSRRCRPFPPLPAVIPQCRPLHPLTTGSSYAALSLLCWLWFSSTGLTLSQSRVHLLSTTPLPTLLAVAYLSCRLLPCLLLPSSLLPTLTNEPLQLGNKPEQNPKIPFY